MAIYELTQDAITPIATTTFAAAHVQERQDLQRLLRASIEVVAPGTMVLAEEFSEWEGSARRIDLLALDEDANLVVIELKRDDDGSHMELQALRYAAMVSTLTFLRAVEVHQAYLQRLGISGDARQRILQHLDWLEPREEDFAQDVRVVLVSANFSKEITSTVMWLNERALDIRCVRIQPYELEGRMLLDVQQIIPLPEAADFQVQLKEKAAEKRAAKSGADFTRYDLLLDDGTEFPAQWKNRLMHRVAEVALRAGVLPESLPFPSGKWLEVHGTATDAPTFLQLARAQHPSRAIDGSRWFLDQDQLFQVGSRTFALSKMWSGSEALPLLDQIIAEHPNLGMRYRATGTTTPSP